MRNSIYRVNAVGEIETAVPKPRRGRGFWILGVSLAAHVALLGAAFASRAPAPRETTTEVVRVLAGRVDAETGAFHASGITDARIKVACAK